MPPATAAARRTRTGHCTGAACRRLLRGRQRINGIIRSIDSEFGVIPGVMQVPERCGKKASPQYQMYGLTRLQTTPYSGTGGPFTDGEQLMILSLITRARHYTLACAQAWTTWPKPTITAALRRTEDVETDGARVWRVSAGVWWVRIRSKVQLAPREAEPWRAVL